MTRPRIEPVKTVKKGRRLDEQWPGVIYSTWTFGKVKVRRERKFKVGIPLAPWFTSWQLWIALGKTKVGFRSERTT